MKKVTVYLVALFTILSLQSFGQVVDNKIFVNPNTGSDSNKGTKESPLKSLSEAAKRVSAAEGEGAIGVFLAAGVYGMSETADFNPKKWKFTKANRLTIRAEILPDDANWTPAEMPIMISTMPFSVEKNDKGELTGGQNFGIMIQNSHATIQGLRILGEPVHENPSKGVLVRNYPIMWEGKNLEDFRVSQCLFLGNKYALPNHLGILANGKEQEIDHCVFYGVKDALVLWNSPATNSSMHHNLVIDSYGGIVWTWSATPDFKFYNNVISNGNVLWMLNKDEKDSYTIENSVIVGYNSFVNKGGGPQGFGEKASDDKLKLGKDVILKKEGKLEVIEDQTSKYFLHIKAGTLGSNLGAGLFMK
ncbi:hypothetical protein [Arcicella lustrica]|uniref:Right handed beta helix domain-containing protein n=1 Tax=Arcicella lustrica TaxID=2984196 RepID=A0ABU5SQ41_9BACT|nr:hypothetical protein [Arcicella sp. DC25W]MEA5429438.1 hypothetical protein [Arcicella sp. DC25W]